MVFPKSNLATASQPWGRFVETSIKSLETVTATERVNNAARDAQAALGIKRLDASLATVAQLAETTAQNVLEIELITDNVFSPGTTEINGYNIKAGTINASSINAGTLTGFTIQTASSGTRVVMGGTQVDFYQGSSFAGRIIGSTWDGGSSLDLGGSGSGRVAVTDDGVGIFGASSTELTVGGSFGNIQIFSLSGGIGSKGNWSHGNGTFSASGNVSAGGLLYNYGITSVGAAANVRIGADYRFYIGTSSSQRYKENIVDIYSMEDLDPKKLLDIPVRAFKYRTDYRLPPTDRRYQVMIPGFIAEEVNEFYPAAVDYEGDLIESWNERMMIPGMLALIQDLYKEIEILKGAQ